MQSDVQSRPGGDTLATAAEIISSQQQRIGLLLERVRREHREHLQHFRDVERGLQDTSQRLEQVRSADLDDSARTLESAALREQHQMLRQQQAWLAEKLITLGSTARKLQTTIRQSQINADYLLGNVGTDSEQVERCADLSQLHSLEVQEEERQRLAREIHDGPAQTLANAIFQLEYCLRLLERDPRRLEGELARLRDDLREGLADTRYFIFDLRPGPLAELGLVATLRRYAENYQSRFGIEVDLRLDDDLPRLSPAKEMATFRVVQEALQNTRKHSAASQVTVALGRDGDVVYARVEDNGQGFDPATASTSTTRHFGLLSMQERAQIVRGEIQIESQPGQGTKVTLRVPLDQNPEL